MTTDKSESKAVTETLQKLNLVILVYKMHTMYVGFYIPYTVESFQRQVVVPKPDFVTCYNYFEHNNYTNKNHDLVCDLSSSDVTFKLINPFNFYRRIEIKGLVKSNLTPEAFDRVQWNNFTGMTVREYNVPYKLPEFSA